MKETFLFGDLPIDETVVEDLTFELIDLLTDSNCSRIEGVAALLNTIVIAISDQSPETTDGMIQTVIEYLLNGVENFRKEAGMAPTFLTEQGNVQ